MPLEADAATACHCFYVMPLTLTLALTNHRIIGCLIISKFYVCSYIMLVTLSLSRFPFDCFQASMQCVYSCTRSSKAIFFNETHLPHIVQHLLSFFLTLFNLFFFFLFAFLCFNSFIIFAMYIYQTTNIFALLQQQNNMCCSNNSIIYMNSRTILCTVLFFIVFCPKFVRAFLLTLYALGTCKMNCEKRGK